MEVTKEKEVIKYDLNTYKRIKSFYEQDKLKIQGIKLKENLFEEFITAIKTLNDIYPNAWDFKYYKKKDCIDIYGVYIHFPEIKLKNSNGKSHIIYDLFVLVEFIINKINNKETIGISNIRGNRSTYKNVEVNCGYVHSHLSMLPDARNNNFGAFCLGSGEINMYLANINAGETTEDNWYKLWLQVHALVSWESLEGVPHKYMKDIRLSHSSSRRNLRYFNNGSDTIYILLEELKKAIRSEDIIVPFIIFNNKYKIKDELTLFKDLLEYTKNNSSPLSKEKFLAYKLNGDYYAYNEGNKNLLKGSVQDSYKFKYPKVCIFKGEEITKKVIDFKQRNKENKVFEIDFTLSTKERLIKLIENETNRKAIRKSAIKDFSESCNA